MVTVQNTSTDGEPTALLVIYLPKSNRTDGLSSLYTEQPESFCLPWVLCSVIQTCCKNNQLVVNESFYVLCANDPKLIATWMGQMNYFFVYL